MNAMISQFDEILIRESANISATPAPPPIAGHDRFDRGVRIVDALGVDLSLDADVLDMDGLIN